MKEGRPSAPEGAPIRRRESHDAKPRGRADSAPGIDRAWRLALALALQTTLDPERTIEIFARHGARVVAHDHVAFTAPKATLEAGSGRPGSGRHAIELRIEERRLGALTFTRRHPFRIDEIRALESMGADLARPLDNALRHREVREAATRDPLTGAATRALLEDTLEREASLVHRHGGALALLMIDVDRFKGINDRFGHPAGDRCLAAIAECIARRIRSSDILFRYGGEEFCVLLPRTGEGGARRLAERVRSAVDTLRIPAGEGAIRPTISLGVAAALPGDGAAGLLAKADAALYRAKRSGRNRVAAAGRSAATDNPSRHQARRLRA